jgi:anti-sigma factor RsiW
MSDPRDHQTNGHQGWDELAAGYALDALDSDEGLLFAEHLETCDRCRTSVDEHLLVAAQLGAIARADVSAEPPSWDAIRAPVLGARDVVDRSAERRRHHMLSGRLLAMAAAVVIVAGSIAIWRGTSGEGGCSASAGCHQIQLDATGGHLAASLVVKGRSVIMQPSGMAAAPSGRIYALWQVPQRGRPELLTTFTASQPKAVTAALESPYADTSGFAVSVERAASPPPSTPSNEVASGNVL